MRNSLNLGMCFQNNIGIFDLLEEGERDRPKEGELAQVLGVHRCFVLN